MHKPQNLPYSPLGNFILQYLPGPSSRPFQPEPVPGLKQLMLEVGDWGGGVDATPF